tara:strand:+ start:37 stop:243 length:207 start_codon:yes stop_codon:yes gene_type:complete
MHECIRSLYLIEITIVILIELVEKLNGCSTASSATAWTLTRTSEASLSSKCGILLGRLTILFGQLSFL